MQGLIIAKDTIPIIQEVADLLDQHFDGEQLSMAETYVQNNKHNSVTSTYYLLLKKKERVTGRNYLYEMVTNQKRLHSTSSKVPTISPFTKTVTNFKTSFPLNEVKNPKFVEK